MQKVLEDIGETVEVDEYVEEHKRMDVARILIRTNRRLGFQENVWTTITGRIMSSLWWRIRAAWARKRRATETIAGSLHHQFRLSQTPQFSPATKLLGTTPALTTATVALTTWTMVFLTTGTISVRPKLAVTIG